MKKLFILMAAALMLPACDKDSGGGASGSEKAAIARFEADGKAFKEWTEKNKPGPDNPSAGLGFVDEMVTKMKAIKTDGLPADLKAAYAKLVAAAEKMQAVVKDFPKDQEGFMKFITEKATSDPAFMQKFQTEMETLQKEGDAAGKELETVAKKHGIEGLDLGPDNK